MSHLHPVVPTRVVPTLLSMRLTDDMRRLGRMVCVSCGIHGLPGGACGNCGGELVPLRRAV